MGSVSSKAAAMSPVRKKQMMILVALVAVIALIAFGAAFLGSPSEQPPPPAPESTRKTFGPPGGQVNNADVWRTQEGARVTQLQDQLTTMQKRLEDKERAEAEERAREKEAEARRVEEEKAKAQLEAQRQAQAGPPGNGLPAQTGPLGQPPGVGGVEPVKGIMRVDLASNGSVGGKTVPGAPPQPGAVPAGGTGGDVVGEQSAETYIPPGAFMRGVLLVGLDAPTGGQAQQNPHPVVVEVLDLASLPNKFKADYKNCRVTANGAGDLSSERAYIRLDRLSCITNDGGAIDIGVKGYIADQTGKAGVRGRLVSKQGQVLANSLIAGIASGIGNAFAQGAMTTSVSPLGATQTVNSGQQWQAGLGQGVGTALNQLSRYYIQLAEKMFPVIEVDAGQPVEIVFTQGVKVARK